MWYFSLYFFAALRLTIIFAEKYVYFFEKSSIKLSARCDLTTHHQFLLSFNKFMNIHSFLDANPIVFVYSPYFFFMMPDARWFHLVSSHVSGQKYKNAFQQIAIVNLGYDFCTSKGFSGGTVAQKGNWKIWKGARCIQSYRAAGCC